MLPTIPAVFMVELGDAAATIVGHLAAEDAKAASEWLGRRLEGVYLGDLIGAQAIRTLAETTGGFSEEIIHGLFSITPREERVEDRADRVREARWENGPPENRGRQGVGV